MEISNKNFKDYYVIDFAHITKTIFQKIWAIILAGVMMAAIGFSAATFFIEPLYSSSVRLYVNNSSISIGSASLSISSSEISAAQSLVRTYIVILKDQTTLEKVIEKANLSYTHEELYDMIEAFSVDDTEVMKVVITSKDPYEASRIANCIADVLQIRIAEIIKGTSMEVVGYATPDLHKISYDPVSTFLQRMLLFPVLFPYGFYRPPPEHTPRADHFPHNRQSLLPEW